jgi:hypothetical protein
MATNPSTQVVPSPPKPNAYSKEISNRFVPDVGPVARQPKFGFWTMANDAYLGAIEDEFTLSVLDAERAKWAQIFGDPIGSEEVEKEFPLVEYKGGMTRQQAKILQDLKQVEIDRGYRRTHSIHGPGDLVTSFVIGMAGSMTGDPVNVASMFVPILQPEIILGAAGKTAARSLWSRMAFGSAVATIDTAAKEPFIFMSKQQVNAEYGPTDSLMAMLAAPVIGAGFAGAAHSLSRLVSFSEIHGAPDSVTREMARVNLALNRGLPFEEVIKRTDILEQIENMTMDQLEAVSRALKTRPAKLISLAEQRRRARGEELPADLQRRALSPEEAKAEYTKRVEQERLRPTQKNLRENSRPANIMTRDAKGKVKTAGTAEDAVAILMKKVFGVDVRFFDAEAARKFGASGAFFGRGDNTIYVQGGTKQEMLRVVGHEFSHKLRWHSPQLFKEVVNAFREAAENGDDQFLRDAWQRAIDEQGKPFAELDPGHRFDEVIANVLGDVFQSDAFWNTLKKRNRSAFQRLLGYLKYLMNEIRKVAKRSDNPFLKGEYDDLAKRIGAILSKHDKGETVAARMWFDTKGTFKGRDYVTARLHDNLKWVGKRPWAKAMENQRTDEYLMDDILNNIDDAYWGAIEDWGLDEMPTLDRRFLKVLWWGDFEARERGVTDTETYRVRTEQKIRDANKEKIAKKRNYEGFVDQTPLVSKTLINTERVIAIERELEGLLSLRDELNAEKLRDRKNFDWDRLKAVQQQIKDAEASRKQIILEDRPRVLYYRTQKHGKYADKVRRRWEKTGEDSINAWADSEMTGTRAEYRIPEEYLGAKVEELRKEVVDFPETARNVWNLERKRLFARYEEKMAPLREQIEEVENVLLEDEGWTLGNREMAKRNKNLDRYSALKREYDQLQRELNQKNEKITEIVRGFSPEKKKGKRKPNPREEGRLTRYSKLAREMDAAVKAYNKPGSDKKILWLRIDRLGREMAAIKKELLPGKVGPEVKLPEVPVQRQEKGAGGRMAQTQVRARRKADFDRDYLRRELGIKNMEEEIEAAQEELARLESPDWLMDELDATGGAKPGEALRGGNAVRREQLEARIEELNDWIDEAEMEIARQQSLSSEARNQREVGIEETADAFFEKLMDMQKVHKKEQTIEQKRLLREALKDAMSENPQMLTWINTFNKYNKYDKDMGHELRMEMEDATMAIHELHAHIVKTLKDANTRFEELGIKGRDLEKGRYLNLSDPLAEATGGGLPPKGTLSYDRLVENVEKIDAEQEARDFAEDSGSDLMDLEGYQSLDDMLETTPRDVLDLAAPEEEAPDTRPPVLAAMMYALEDTVGLDTQRWVKTGTPGARTRKLFDKVFEILNDGDQPEKAERLIEILRDYGARSEEAQEVGNAIVYEYFQRYKDAIYRLPYDERPKLLQNLIQVDEWVTRRPMRGTDTDWRQTDAFLDEVADLQGNEGKMRQALDDLREQRKHEMEQEKFHVEQADAETTKQAKVFDGFDAEAVVQRRLKAKSPKIQAYIDIEDQTVFDPPQSAEEWDRLKARRKLLLYDIPEEHQGLATKLARKRSAMLKRYLFMQKYTAGGKRADAETLLKEARTDQFFRGMTEKQAQEMAQEINRVKNISRHKHGDNWMQEDELWPRMDKAHQAEVLALLHNENVSRRVGGLETFTQLMSYIDGKFRGFAGPRTPHAAGEGTSYQVAMNTGRTRATANVHNLLIHYGLVAKIKADPAARKTLIRAIKGIDTGDEGMNHVGKVIRNTYKGQLADMKDMGIDVEWLDGFAFSRIHDPRLIEKNRAQWDAFMMENIDWRKTATLKGWATFNLTAERKQAYLDELFESIKEGTPRPLGEIDVSTLGGSTGRIDHKTFYFRNDKPDVDYDYDEMFGSGGSTYDVILSQLTNRNDQVEALRHFGHNWKEWVVREANDRNLSSIEAHILNNTVAHAMGELDIPVNKNLSAWGQITRRTMNLIALNAATLTALSDVVTVTSSLRYMGVDVSVGDIATDVFRSATRHGFGAHADNPVAARFRGWGVGINVLNSSLIRRLGGDVAAYGRVKQMNDFMFKWNGMNFWNTIIQESMVDIMTRELGQQISNGEFTPEMIRALKRHGLGPHHFRNARNAVIDIGDGFYRLAPDKISGPVTQQRVRNFLDDFMRQGVLEPDISDEALLRAGTRSGTVLGEATRMITQYRSFPLAMITKTWFRIGRGYNGEKLLEWSERGFNGAQIEAMVFTATALAVGYWVLNLKEIANFRDPIGIEDLPNLRNLGRVVRQSGAAGPLDMLFDVLEPDQLLGPVPGQALRLGEAAGGAMRGSAGKFQSVGLDSIPLTNFPIAREVKKQLFATIFSDVLGSMTLREYLARRDEFFYQDMGQGRLNPFYDD